MTAFQNVLDKAIQKHGEKGIEERLPEPATPAQLKKISDDRYFSRMSFRVFSTGLKHEMVRSKWPAFEEAFHRFAPGPVSFMNDEDLDRLMANTGIIRHGGKIRATIHNASAMIGIAEEFGGFGNYLSDWPSTDVVGLWEDIGKRFKHVGGNSGPYFLRTIGKDTFTISPDVVSGLEHWCGMKDAAKNKGNRKRMQEQFNVWADETGRPYCELSMILALSV